MMVPSLGGPIPPCGPCGPTGPIGPAGPLQATRPKANIATKKEKRVSTAHLLIVVIKGNLPRRRDRSCRRQKLFYKKINFRQNRPSDCALAARPRAIGRERAYNRRWRSRRICRAGRRRRLLRKHGQVGICLSICVLLEKDLPEVSNELLHIAGLHLVLGLLQPPLCPFH